MAAMDGPTPRFDTVIAGATIVDGTGAKGFAGAVGMRREQSGGSSRLTVLRDEAAIRDARALAHRTIDATGKVVAPGFVDLHSHSGLMILANPRHEAKVRQGVTSEVVGVDGLSYAPIQDHEQLAELVEMNAGLDGHPSIEFDWDSVPSYLDRFDAGVSVNIAMLVGNSALRLGAIGWEAQEARSGDQASMASMLREAMEEGAYGLSSGLDYPPGSYATTGELANLASAAAKLGGFYHTHVRYALGDRFLDPFREAIEIGRQGGSPAHITHFYHRQTFPGTPEQMLGLVDDAR